MKTMFEIPYPADKARWSKQYGLNSVYAGKPWQERRRDALFWHMKTVSALNAAGIEQKPFQKPVVITFYWNDRMDISNHAYMAKMIEDGLKGRLIVDDSKKYVVGHRHYFHEKNTILVILEETENETN